MRYKTTFSFLTIVAIFFTGCFFGAGTHGSLKNYEYGITKDKLDSAIMFVINSNPNIIRDTVGEKILADIGGGKKDTIVDNSWNDGHEYVTIKIKTTKGLCDYTFRYYGDEEHWKTSNTSEIFICWAYDENHEGGSEGNGGIDNKTLTYLANVFEKELVKKVDVKLGITHKTSK